MNLDLKVSQKLSSGQYFLKQNQKYIYQMVEKVPKFKIGNRYCALCIAEKRHIMFSDPKITINKRNEFVSKCRHQNKFKLKAVKEEKT